MSPLVIAFWGFTSAGQYGLPEQPGEWAVLGGSWEESWSVVVLCGYEAPGPSLIIPGCGDSKSTPMVGTSFQSKQFLSHIWLLLKMWGGVQMDSYVLF